MGVVVPDQIYLRCDTPGCICTVGQTEFWKTEEDAKKHMGYFGWEEIDGRYVCGVCRIQRMHDQIGGCKP